MRLISVDSIDDEEVPAIPIEYIEKLSWEYGHSRDIAKREPAFEEALDTLIERWNEDKGGW